MTGMLLGADGGQVKIDAGIALPGNGTGFDLGSQFVLTAGGVARLYENFGTAALVDWKPSGDSLFLGNFATNALAYAAADARGYVTGGTPDTGVWFWHTTYNCRRAFDGTIWRGFAQVGPVLAGTVTRSVNSATGSDITGNGTGGLPYASTAAAAQDVPAFADQSTFNGYIINVIGAGPYVFNPAEFAHVKTWHLAGLPAVSIQGNETNTAAFPESVDGVVTIQGGGVTQDSRAEGREYVVNSGGAPMVAHAYIGQPCTIDGCAAHPDNDGLHGVVIDNTATAIYVVFEPGATFGDMAAADTIQMFDYDAELNIPNVFIGFAAAAIRFSQLNIDTGTWINSAAHIECENCRFVNDAYIQPQYHGRTTYQNCAFINPDAGGQYEVLTSGDGGLVVLEGYNLVSGWDDNAGAAQVLLTGGRGSRIELNGEIVFANITKWNFEPDIQIGIQGSLGGATGDTAILLHGVVTDFMAPKVADSSMNAMDIALPLINTPTAFPLAGYLVDMYNTTRDALHPGSQIAFLETPVVVTVGATNALCRMSTVAGQYFYHNADGREIMAIRGTGNTPKRIAIVNDHTVLAGDGVESIDCSPPGTHIALVLPAPGTELGRRISLNRLTAAGAPENVNITGTINAAVNPTVIPNQWDSITIEQTATEYRQVAETP